MRAFLMVLGLVLGTPAPVSIKASPQVLMGGGTVRVTCTVPRHVSNRELRIGIAGYTESGRQLEGDSAPVTHTSTFTHVPCDADAAYCALLRNDDSLTVVKVTLLVSCS